jgi:cytochrome P450
MELIDGLPPGPRLPVTLQTLAMRTRQRPFFERQRRRYGPMFSMRVHGLGPIVTLSDPALIKETFKADPTVLHAGTASPLREMLGENSLLGIDEEQHMEQRKLLLPPFKGQRMKAYEPMIAEIAGADIDTWPVQSEFPVARPMQRITLRAILRAVFGAEGSRLDTLEDLFPRWTALGPRVAMSPWLRKDLGPRSPWGAFLRRRAEIDVILDELIALAKADPELEQRVDVLALMVQAHHEDGSPMSDAEIRDELATMIVAGHETSAHTLSWTVERLRRHPEVLERLVAEVDEGGKALREATIREALRARPVVSFAVRYTRKPFELGCYRLPVGTRILTAAILTHYDPRLFPHPDRFDPDRFLGVTPDTYSWIPFGGGVRRCIGASFAQMEMDVVLRVMLEKIELLPTTEREEQPSFRGVVWAPDKGGRLVMRRRTQSRASGDASDQLDEPAPVGAPV